MPKNDPCNFSSSESRAIRKIGCARRWRARSRSKVWRLLSGGLKCRPNASGRSRKANAARRTASFIQLELDKNGTIPEKVWFMIKETDGVGDFIGSNGKPTAMSPKDEAKMLEEADRPEEAPRLEAQFKKGDRIKVTNGAFVNFEGEVDELIP